VALLERILAESRANAFKADIVSLELELSLMISANCWRVIKSERTRSIPRVQRSGGYWTGLYLSVGGGL
jgi:hypothetical protein